MAPIAFTRWIRAPNWSRLISTRCGFPPGRRCTGWLQITGSIFRQQFTNNPLAMNGVLVHWATNTAGPDHNQLLDMNPGGVFDFRDAPLAVGRTFGDTARAIFITPTTRGTNTSPPGSAAPSTCRTPPR